MMGGYAGAALMGTWGWLGMLAGLLVWVGVIVLAVWGASVVVSRRGAGAPDALELVRRRYARGEITAAEFAQAKRVLA